MQNNYNNLLEDVKVKVHALQAIKHQDWQLEINKDGYQVYIKENPENGLNINRIETEAKVNPEELIQVLGDFNKRKEFDENFVDGKVLEEIDENTKIIYQQGKSPAVLIDARDFVMIVRKIKFDNGFLLLSRSVEHPAAPSAKGFTRAEIIFNGWFLTVQPNGLTKIVVISHIDAKGDVPKAFINQGYKKQAENVKKVLEYIAKHQQLSYLSIRYMKIYINIFNILKLSITNENKNQKHNYLQKMDQLKDIVETFTNLKISDDEFTLEAFIKGMKDKEFKKIYVLAGAGISVAAGIPDFRSPGTGLYDQIEKFDLPYPEAIFEINYFKQNPQAFYTIAKEFMLGLEAKPVLAHKFLKMLQDREQLALCFTQNIDGLELDAGLKEEKLIQAHGHMRTAHCLECKEEASIKDFKKNLEKSEIMYCEKCKKGLIKPDVVFFGEGLPKEFFCNWKQLKNADLVIVMGTSLQVKPFAMSVQQIGQDVPIVVLNRENVVPNRKKVLHFPGDIEPNVQKILDLLK